MNKTTFEEYLNQNGTLTYRNVGTSMLPMIKQNRDIFTLKKKDDTRCKKYDVVLYKRPPNKYVLHRVIEVRDNDYVILGDNCVAKEYGIKDEDVLAVLTSFVHKGKSYSVDDIVYRVYVQIWCHTYHLRVFFKKLKSKLRRVLR